MSQIVTVFGGSRPTPDDPAYARAERLGRLLAEAGYTVQTGGYSGTMEAVSKGARSAGGHVIGVTVGLFEKEGGAPNAYNSEIVQYDMLTERLLHLVKSCHAAIALAGGIGTLSEVALTWSLLQTGEISPRPFILVGDSWKRTLQTLYGTGEYIRDADMSLFQTARTPRQAITLLRNWEADQP